MSYSMTHTECTWQIHMDVMIKNSGHYFLSNKQKWLKMYFYDRIFVNRIRKIYNQFVQLKNLSSCSRKPVSSGGFLFPSLARQWKRMSCCWLSCWYYWSCWLSCWFSHWFSWLFGCWFNCCFRLVSFAIKNFCKVFKHEFGRIYSSIMNLFSHSIGLMRIVFLARVCRNVPFRPFWKSCDDLLHPFAGIFTIIAIKLDISPFTVWLWATIWKP